MSEKKARRKRATQASSAEPPKQPVEQPGSITIAELLQLLGAKEAQIMLLQRSVTGLQQQVLMLSEQAAKVAKKDK